MNQLKNNQSDAIFSSTFNASIICKLLYQMLFYQKSDNHEID